jgi:hypothetical protein
MIFQPSGIRMKVKRSDMRTPEPANFPDQFATSSQTAAMDSSMSTAYDARLDIRSRAVSIDPIEEEAGSYSQLFACVTKERGLRVKGRTHEFALPLLAAIDVPLGPSVPRHVGTWI